MYVCTYHYLYYKLLHTLIKLLIVTYVRILSIVPLMTAPSITRIVLLSSTSFTVSWTITDPDHNYIVTWTNLHTGMMSSVTVPENTNSYMVTGLNGVDNYNVSVAANNSCGMMMNDTITVYGKNMHMVDMYVCRYIRYYYYYYKPADYITKYV